MLGWLVLGCAVFIMAKVAHMEERSPILWGGITFLICVATTITIPLPFISMIIGLAISFTAMFVVKLLEK
jgi:hypothetical protein